MLYIHPQIQKRNTILIFPCIHLLHRSKMALKAVRVSDVPNLDQVHDNHALPSNATLTVNGDMKSKKFVVMGHRGSGMNMLQSPDPRMKAIKENSICSFNAAGRFNIDYIEFDVQVTKDGCPVIFHDIFIMTEEKGKIVEKRVTEITLDEFLSYGPQKESKKVEKPLFRKTKDGQINQWMVEQDDHLCTLEEVFEKVNHPLGFNIELKFDDNINFTEKQLSHTIQAVLQVVFKSAKNRSILFSSFQPDAAQLIRKMQNTYPVYFLTNGGSEIYSDTRRNSIDEAIKLCLAGGLEGIVCEVKAVLRNPRSISKIKESNLSIISYGKLNNLAEAVYVQYLMGVEGVIVDLIEKITEPASVSRKAIEVHSESMMFQWDRLVALEQRKIPC